MAAQSVMECAVQALVEGRLEEAEELFISILMIDPTHPMANCGLKDVVHARIVANRVRTGTPPAPQHRSL